MNMTAKLTIMPMALAFALAMAPPSFAQKTSQSGQTISNPATKSSSDAKQANPNQNSTQASSPSQVFLQTIAREDTAEINLAKLALKKSKNPQVRKYAQSILSADPAMRQGAEKVARSEHLTIDTGGNTAGQAEYQTLQVMSGKQFDKAYMKYEAKKQANDLELVNQEIKVTKDQKVKNYAQKERPAVQKAAKKSQQLGS